MSRLLVLSLLVVAVSAGRLPFDPPVDGPPPVDAELKHRQGTPYLFEYHNPEMTDDGQELFESDMVLTEEQKRDRKASPNLWPGGQVKYAITSSSANDRQVIREALNHWMQKTCVRFQEVSASYNSGPHLRFTKQTGCWSYVGRINTRQGQDISIGNNCEDMGTIAHEVGHALGFNHEQSRTDRDTYVTVLTYNIQKGKDGNFEIAHDSNNYSVPYDYTSIMHYGSNYFTKNGQPTIAVNQVQYTGLIGSRAGLSHRDQHLANLMYSCAASCSRPPRCQNGGFVNKGCSCTCPANTSGRNCQTLRGPYYGEVCGNQHITRPGTITSVNYPSVYPPGQTCFWIITAPAGRRVKISFGEVKVLYRDNGCPFDHINLYTDDDSVSDMNTCGSELENSSLTTSGRRLVVEMKSYPQSYPSMQKGFTAKVSFV